jgi:hypothetical protein
MAMSYLDSLKAYQDGQSGINQPGYTDPNWSSWKQGEAQSERDQVPRVPRAPREPLNVSEYFGALVGLPIAVGLVAGVAALLSDADYTQWALMSGLAAFGVVLAVGLLWLAIRLLLVSVVLVVALAPVALIVALGLYLLDRVGIGPGLPT